MKKEYNLNLTENEFFTILNSLYEYRTNIKNPNKINKLLNKLDDLYFNENE